MQTGLFMHSVAQFEQSVLSPMLFWHRAASLDSPGDESSERFWSARSRALSTASSIYADAESEFGSEASGELLPAQSVALAQMQVGSPITASSLLSLMH